MRTIRQINREIKMIEKYEKKVKPVTRHEWKEIYGMTMMKKAILNEEKQYVRTGKCTGHIWNILDEGENRKGTEIYYCECLICHRKQVVKG